MRVFFDVDYTILGLDGSLRPGTREVFERIVADGHQLYVWSGGGTRWDDIRGHDLEHLVTDCFQKPLANHHAALSELGVPHVPDFVVDDSVEIATVFGGVLVAAYTAGTPSDYLPRDRDRELHHAYEVLQEFAATGTSKNPRFYAKGSQARLS